MELDGPCSIAMLIYQRVNDKALKTRLCHRDVWPTSRLERCKQWTWIIVNHRDNMCLAKYGDSAKHMHSKDPQPSGSKLMVSSQCSPLIPQLWLLNLQSIDTKKSREVFLLMFIVIKHIYLFLCFVCPTFDPISLQHVLLYLLRYPSTNQLCVLFLIDVYYGNGTPDHLGYPFVCPLENTTVLFFHIIFSRPAPPGQLRRLRRLQLSGPRPLAAAARGRRRDGADAAVSGPGHGGAVVAGWGGDTPLKLGMWDVGGMMKRQDLRKIGHNMFSKKCDVHVFLVQFGFCGMALRCMFTSSQHFPSGFRVICTWHSWPSRLAGPMLSPVSLKWF